MMRIMLLDYIDIVENFDFTNRIDHVLKVNRLR